MTHLKVVKDCCDLSKYSRGARHAPDCDKFYGPAEITEESLAACGQFREIVESAIKRAPGCARFCTEVLVDEEDMEFSDPLSKGRY